MQRGNLSFLFCTGNFAFLNTSRQILHSKIYYIYPFVFVYPQVALSDINPYARITVAVLKDDQSSVSPLVEKQWDDPVFNRQLQVLLSAKNSPLYNEPVQFYAMVRTTVTIKRDCLNEVVMVVVVGCVYTCNSQILSCIYVNDTRLSYFCRNKTENSVRH